MAYEIDVDFFKELQNNLTELWGDEDARNVLRILRSKRIYTREVLSSYLDAIKNRGRPTRIPLGVIVMLEEKYLLRTLPRTVNTQGKRRLVAKQTGCPNTPFLSSGTRCRRSRTARPPGASEPGLPTSGSVAKTPASAHARAAKSSRSL